MMESDEVISSIMQHKLVAIARRVPVERMLDTAKALYGGGVRLLEVTFDQSSPTCVSDAKESIRRVVEGLEGKMLVGAGTVVTVEQARAAKDAGALFALAPDTNLSVISEVKRLGMVSVPGALTPTEILSAWNAGADIVKLFPAGILGVPYLKAVRGPISQVPLMAVGGISKDNVHEFLSSGFCSCGIGSNIVRNDLIKAGDYGALEQVARSFVLAAEGR